MKGIVLLIVALTLGFASGMTVLKPLDGKGGLVNASLVIVQGAQIDADAYIPLAQQIQTQFPFNLWVALPVFPNNLALPFEIDAKMNESMQALAGAGAPADAKLIALGHSLGGATLQDWTAANPARVFAQVCVPVL